MSNNSSLSLVAEGFDGIEPRGLPGGIESKDHADGGGDRYGGDAGN